MSWNAALFLALNASARPGPVQLAALVGLANLPLLLAPLLLAWLWVAGSAARRPGLIAAGCAVFIGQGINQLLGMAWDEPRPFVAHIGHTWMAHAADNGFPSDHATLAWSLGLGLLLAGVSRTWGLTACAIGIVTGWARVRLGVHMPVDVIASVPAGLLAAVLARSLLVPIRLWVAPAVGGAYDRAVRLLPGRPSRHEPGPRRSA